MMLQLLLMVGCGPSIPEPTAPGAQSLLTGTVGVDPETDDVWAAVQLQDEALWAEFEVWLGETELGQDTGFEESYFEWVLLLEASQTTVVYRVDGESLVAQEMGQWAGQSAPIARFSTQGPVLTSALVDSQGYLLDPPSMTHTAYARGGGAALQIDGGSLVLSPTREWFLQGGQDGPQRVAPDLGEVLPLTLSETLSFAPDGSLMAQTGRYQVSSWDAATLEAHKLVQLKPLSGELIDWTFHPDLEFAVVTRRAERGGQEMLSMNLDTGALVPMPGFTGGEYNHDGSAFYQQVGQEVLLLDTASQRIQALPLSDIGSAWVTQDGQWLILEYQDGLHLVDLQDPERQSYFNGVGLSQSVMVGETLWSRGAEDQVHILHLDTGTHEAWTAPCSVLSLAYQPVHDRVVVRCQQTELRFFDPLTKNMVGVARLR